MTDEDMDERFVTEDILHLELHRNGNIDHSKRKKAVKTQTADLGLPG